MSDRSPACPHCDLALAELGPEDVSRMELRRWRRKVWRAKNMAYTAMALLIVGAVRWWLVGPAGWTIPPPPLPVGLIMLSCSAYLIARGWPLCLNTTRNRPRAARQHGLTPRPGCSTRLTLTRRFMPSTCRYQLPRIPGVMVTSGRLLLDTL